MTGPTFPARLADGSFCVEVGLSLLGGDLKAEKSMQRWFAKMLSPKNEVWERVWRTGTGLQDEHFERLSYWNEFSSPPAVKVRSSSEVQLRFYGKADSKFWKDWIFLKIIPEFKKEFEPVGDVLYIRNAEN
jgi:hypothetical protein